MNKTKKVIDGAQLSDTIRSLQNLLDDVSTEVEDIQEPAPDENSDFAPVDVFDETTQFEETTEFDRTNAAMEVPAEETGTFSIDSHFDMNIPPALPNVDEQDEEDELAEGEEI